MNYQEFIQHISSILETRLAGIATVSIKPVTKNNNIILDALLITTKGVNISPTIYLKPYYHRYLEGNNLDDICEDIYLTYMNHRITQNVDLDFFTDFSQAHSRIVFKLVNYSQNKELLEEVPHKRYLDLAIIYQYLMPDNLNEDGFGTILIHNHELAMWNTSVDELHNCALVNSPKLLPYRLMDLNSSIFEALNQEPSPDFPSFDSCVPLYVLSNQYNLHGAATLLYPGVLEQIAEELDSDLLILPSSIHETLLAPTNCLDLENDYDFFHQMVQEINETQVADQEVLSTHAYVYTRQLHMICQSLQA